MSSATATYDASQAPKVKMKTEEGKASITQSDNATSRGQRPANSTTTEFKQDALLYIPLKRPSLPLTPDSKYHPGSSKKIPFRCDQYNCKYWVTKGFCHNRLTTCKWRHDEERRNVWPWRGDLDEAFPDMVGQYSE